MLHSWVEPVLQERLFMYQLRNSMYTGIQMAVRILSMDSRLILLLRELEQRPDQQMDFLDIQQQF